MPHNKFEPTSLVDSTYRLKLEITKEKFDNCQYPDKIGPCYYYIDINEDIKESEWYFGIYPKGKNEKDKNNVVICFGQGDVNPIKARCKFEIETFVEEYEETAVEKMYSRGTSGEGRLLRKYAAWEPPLCTTEEFETHFVGNTVTIVASLVIYDNFVDDMRSMSSHDNLRDFTIISSSTEFPCHRVILATRSEYFEALFRNEPVKKELKVDEAPEVVKTMLEFMSKGLIPDDIEDKAMDLILVSDMYGLDLLTAACETSLVENLSPDNALETFIMIDKVLTYIKKEADQVVKAKDWVKFVQNYPDLISEIVLQCHEDVNNGST